MRDEVPVDLMKLVFSSLLRSGRRGGEENGHNQAQKILGEGEEGKRLAPRAASLLGRRDDRGHHAAVLLLFLSLTALREKGKRGVCRSGEEGQGSEVNANQRVGSAHLEKGIK